MRGADNQLRMRDADNHVSVGTGIIKQAADVIETLEESGMEPDRVTIQQSNVGDKEEFNLAYKLEGDSK